MWPLGGGGGLIFVLYLPHALLDLLAVRWLGSVHLREGGNRMSLGRRMFESPDVWSCVGHVLDMGFLAECEYFLLP
jgi:hypothetical protein